jgi:hypothetical protein
MAIITHRRGRLSDTEQSAGDAFPRRRSDLVYRKVEAETVILNRNESVLHQLNETASLIWDCCDGTHSIGGIAGRLAAEYDVDAGISRNDVERVVSDLKKLNLLYTN